MPANVYAIFGPLVLILVLVEFFYCLYKKNGYYTFQDSVSSLGTIIITQCTNLPIAFGIFYIFDYLFQHFAFQKLEMTYLNYALCFFGVDFLFYWFHRMGHHINFLWAAHMPHHSTEELNYAVALRSSMTQRLASFIFYWPLVIVGFSPALVIEMVAFHLLLQFMPHTRVVPKFSPWIEKIFNTPSHHRVHHGLNRQYIDKNFGGFLIIWDRLFGSFEEEKEEVFYGVTKQPKTWDPTFINFQWWYYLYKDFKETPYLWDKIRIWFMPTGWRPRGVSPTEEHPVWTKNNFVKFTSEPISGSYPYLSFQLVLSFIVMFFVIYDHSPLSAFDKTILSLLLWMSTTSWSFFMESKKDTFKLESTRLILTSLFLLYCLNKHDLGAFYIYLTLALTFVSIFWFTRLFKQHALVDQWNENL